jgi:hypothetical protein
MLFIVRRPVRPFFSSCLILAALHATVADAADEAAAPAGAMAAAPEATPAVAPAGTASGAVVISDYWRMVGSPFTQHWHYNPLHRHVYALGLERQHADGSMWGAAYFSNSFGQPSAYAYVGRRYNAILADQPELYFQWTAGVIYGYKGQFKNKVPLNVNGFSPGLVPTLGWQFSDRYEFAVHALGNAGVMFQFSLSLR